MWPSLGKFCKGSQGENTSPGPGFFLGFQPTPLRRFILAFRSVSSGRCSIHAASLVFSATGFHHACATKPARCSDGADEPDPVPLGYGEVSLIPIGQIAEGFCLRETRNDDTHAIPTVPALRVLPSAIREAPARLSLRVFSRGPKRQV
jgi:hypothetical protein